VLYVSGTRIRQTFTSRRSHPTSNISEWGGRSLSTGPRKDGGVISFARPKAFNVASYGLDGAARGIKIEKYRPDLIVFDDIDSQADSPLAVEKKIAAITPGESSRPAHPTARSYSFKT